MTYSGQNNRRIMILSGSVVAGLFVAQTLQVGVLKVHAQPPQLVEAAHAAPVLPERISSPSLSLYESDPMTYLRKSRDQYFSSVRDYQCTFTKQELIGDELTKEQVSDVKFRQSPFSVFMHVHTNPTKARRVLYIQDKWIKNGLQQALIQPEGPIARLLVNSVFRPINGPEAKAMARKTIDEFGVGNSFNLIIKYVDQLGDDSVVRFVGTDTIDGRPTYKFERRLPYDSASGRFPDALLIFHIDQEYHLPVACFSYADSQGQQLLGKYLYTDLQLNVGFQSSDFEAATYGL